MTPYSAPGCIHPIIAIVASYKRIPIDKVMVKTRERQIVQARQLAMFFLNKCTAMSLERIAELFKPAVQDHATVVHSRKTVLNDCCDLEYNYHFKQLESKILNSGYAYLKKN